MIRKILIPGVFFMLVIFATYSCGEKIQQPVESVTGPLPDTLLIARGDHLVSIMGCNDCHSPKNMGPHGPQIDTLKILSGYPSARPLPNFPESEVRKGFVITNGDLTAAMGPWGTSYAANITSDSTGIGGWKEEQFTNALRHGKYKGLEGTRMLMPPMPMQNFAKLADEDIKAIFYYLKSTKPIKNVVPAYTPLATEITIK